jgi:hypothetical protein
MSDWRDGKAFRRFTGEPGGRCSAAALGSPLGPRTPVATDGSFASQTTLGSLLEAASDSRGVLELHGELRCGDKRWTRR